MTHSENRWQSAWPSGLSDALGTQLITTNVSATILPVGNLLVHFDPQNYDDFVVLCDAATTPGSTVTVKNVSTTMRAGLDAQGNGNLNTECSYVLFGGCSQTFVSVAGEWHCIAMVDKAALQVWYNTD